MAELKSQHCTALRKKKLWTITIGFNLAAGVDSSTFVISSNPDIERRFTYTETSVWITSPTSEPPGSANYAATPLTDSSTYLGVLAVKL